MGDIWENFLADLKEALSVYDIEEFESLNIQTDSFRVMLLFIWIAIVAALFVMFYNNSYLGGFIKKLIEAEANTPESAKTLAELGIEAKPPLRHSLRDGSVLRKLVQAKDRDETDKTEASGGGSADASGDGSVKARQKAKKAEELAFYIPSELVGTAQKRYRQKGNGGVALIVSVLIISVIMFFAILYSPLLLSFFDGWLASLGLNS